MSSQQMRTPTPPKNHPGRKPSDEPVPPKPSKFKEKVNGKFRKFADKARRAKDFMSIKNLKEKKKNLQSKILPKPNAGQWIAICLMFLIGLYTFIHVAIKDDLSKETREIINWILIISTSLVIIIGGIATIKSSMTHNLS